MPATGVIFAFVLLAACGASPAPVAHEASGASSPWEPLASGTSESLRGLALVSSTVIWASGTHGTVIRSTDGSHFEARVVPGAEALDFRSLHAFDADRAVVLSAGSPARAFVTADGGASWTLTYTREGEGVFFDSLVFRDAREGVALGDPLPSADGRRFALLVTHDGGAHWDEREGPLAEPGEAAFAASNACLAFPAPSTIVFAAGGASPRVLRSTDDGATWTSASVPIAGSPSAGIFALAFATSRVGYAVGGDYAAPTEPGSFAVTRDGGASWTSLSAPRGYRSSVALWLDALLVVGTSGSDVWSQANGRWEPLDDHPLNTIRVEDGGVAIAVGPDGYVARALSAGVPP